MGLAKGVVLLFLLIVVTTGGFGKSKAAVYKVGDSAGWTIVGHVDYRTWASQKTFRVGDVIAFEYNRQFHNVVRVTHRNFNACNSTGAFETFASGNDSFVVRKTGHFYFICGVPGHCQSGQKVDIRVPAGNSSNSPTPTPSPSPIATPPASTPPPPSVHPQPPRSPPPTQPPSPGNPPASQPQPPQSPAPSAISSPQPSAPISMPSTSPSFQPIASPPVNREAPAPSPTSGSSLIYLSMWLILLSAFSLLFGLGW